MSQNVGGGLPTDIAEPLEELSSPGASRPTPALGVGDVVECDVDGESLVGIVIARQPRMRPPDYGRADTFDVLFEPGLGRDRDGLLMNGCRSTGTYGVRLAGEELSTRLRELLEAKAANGDLRPRSLAAFHLMKRRDKELSVARGELEPMPTPHVVRPTLLQLVKGARVHWEDSAGKVHQGWVGTFGVWRDPYNPEAPPAPRVSIEAVQPGLTPISMAMPDQVPVERVLRATCFPDPSPGECWRCHQGGEPKWGENPCEVCSRPTAHDYAEKPEGHHQGAVLAGVAPDMGGGTERP